MERDKLALREELVIISIVHWKLFKEALTTVVCGTFFVCILATCVGLYYGEAAMSWVGNLWLLELYFSLFAIALFLFKRFVVNRLIGKPKHE